MKLEQLFDCPVPVVYQDLTETGTVGHYEPVADRMVICSSIQFEFPFARDIIKLHEMFHATGGKTRSLRTYRLHNAFEERDFRVEECIAEICTLVAMSKMGILTTYSKTIPLKGLNEYYDSDIYIPWIEVVHAMGKFKQEGISFSQELAEIKEYLIDDLKMNVKDFYETNNVLHLTPKHSGL